MNIRTLLATASCLALPCLCHADAAGGARIICWPSEARTVASLGLTPDPVDAKAIGLPANAAPVAPQVALLVPGESEPANRASIGRAALALARRHQPFAFVARDELLAGALGFRAVIVVGLPGADPGLATALAAFESAGGAVVTDLPAAQIPGGVDDPPHTISIRRASGDDELCSALAQGGADRICTAHDDSGREAEGVGVLVAQTDDRTYALYRNEADRSVARVTIGLIGVGNASGGLGSHIAGAMRETIVAAGPALRIASLARAGKGWRADRDRYNDLRNWAASLPHPSATAYRRSSKEVVAYDGRPELGMGMHQADSAQLDMVRALGVRFVRLGLYWSDVERTEQEGLYDQAALERFDAVVKAAGQAGVELVVPIHGNPPGVSWANHERAYQRYARFVAAMAARYPAVRYWELFNEMDTSFTDLFGAGNRSVRGFWGGKLYAEMLRLAYPAIKKANPGAMVVFGGCDGGSVEPFLRGVYEAGGRDFFDVMNIHCYGTPLKWSTVVRPVVCRSLMSQFGDADKPLWLTEFGSGAVSVVSASGYPHARGEQDGPAFDDAQVRELRDAIADIRATGLFQKYFLYQFATDDGFTAEMKSPEYAAKYLPPGMHGADYGFGLTRSDFHTPRPSYDYLLAAQVNAARSTTPTSDSDAHRHR